VRSGRVVLSSRRGAVYENADGTLTLFKNNKVQNQGIGMS
jgi:hypothetical protein